MTQRPLGTLSEKEIIAKADDWIAYESGARVGDDQHPLSTWIENENARRKADLDEWRDTPIKVGEVEVVVGHWYDVAVEPGWRGRVKTMRNCQYRGRSTTGYLADGLIFDQWGAAAATDKYAGARLQIIAQARIREIIPIEVDERIAAKAAAK